MAKTIEIRYNYVNNEWEYEMVTSEEVLKIANLAKLFISESEIEQLTKDISEIISFADAINMAVEDEEIKFNHLNMSNAFYEDEIIESFPSEEILKNRDGGENNCFVVK